MVIRVSAHAVPSQEALSSLSRLAHMARLPQAASSHMVLRAGTHKLPPVMGSQSPHTHAVPSHVAHRPPQHSLSPVTWFSEPQARAAPSHVASSRQAHLHTQDTYILVAFPFLQMAVCETPPTLPIRDELAEKTHRTRLTLR